MSIKSSMKLKVKLRKIGNSFGVILPREVITELENSYNFPLLNGGKVVMDVITNWEEYEKYNDCPDGVITEEQKVPT